MTSPDYGELVKNLHSGAIVSTAWGYTMAEAADAIEQQARRIAELEDYIGKKHRQIERLIQWRDAARDSFEEARDIAHLAIQERNSLRAELIRRAIPLPGEPDTPEHEGISG